LGKDINTPLRKAYVDAIQGLSYLGDSLVCYDGWARDSVNAGKTEYLYCVVQDQTVNDSVRTKNVLAYDTTIVVSIYNGVMGNTGRKKVDDVAGLIYGACVPVAGTGHLNLNASNLDIVTTNVISDVTTTFSTDSHKVWVRSIRFRHQISE
jgi:hypothetical protein